MSTHIHTHSYMSKQYTYPHAHTHTQSYTFICPLNILDRVRRYIEMHRRRRNLAPIRKPLLQLLLGSGSLAAAQQDSGFTSESKRCVVRCQRRGGHILLSVSSIPD